MLELCLAQDWKACLQNTLTKPLSVKAMDPGEMCKVNIVIYENRIGCLATKVQRTRLD